MGAEPLHREMGLARVRRPQNSGDVRVLHSPLFGEETVLRNPLQAIAREFAPFGAESGAKLAR
jgi:hypothetical protein